MFCVQVSISSPYIELVTLAHDFNALLPQQQYLYYYSISIGLSAPFSFGWDLD